MKGKKKRNAPLIVGLTGGIGTGKSTIARVFQWIDIPVYDSDKNAKWLINNDPKLKVSIIELFGKKSFDGKGNYNRSHVASKVFNNSALLKEVNLIVHPAVAKHFKDWVLLNKEKPYILKEAAILFESGAYKSVEKIICVSASESIRIERIKRRDNISELQIKKRFKSQMDQNEKEEKSDFVVFNNDDNLIVPQVMKIHAELLKFS